MYNNDIIMQDINNDIVMLDIDLENYYYNLFSIKIKHYIYKYNIKCLKKKYKMYTLINQLWENNNNKYNIDELDDDKIGDLIL